MSRKKLIGRIVLTVLAVAALLAFFGSVPAREEQPAQPAPEPTPTARVGDVAAKAPAPTDPPLREDKSIYGDGDDLSVVTFYLTVTLGNAVDATNHTWTEINSYDTYYYIDRRIPRYSCEAILQVGDENGPLEGEFGYDAKIPNAVVMVRGQTSSRNAQKNYKVRIKQGNGTWHTLRSLAINKYQDDPTRFKNRLVFSLYKDVPQMTSIRTQFIHLYVKDLTEGGSGQFEDYGLYTLNEPMTRRWLTNHGLDRYGYLYKIVDFEWYEYEPVMLPQEDEEFDELTFDLYLKPKGNTDHSKLQSLISIINDDMTPITEIVDKYFDVENFSYYYAAHILVGNHDSGTRNTYLYSPLNSDKWYFVSWDEDDSFSDTQYRLEEYSEGGSWERGVSMYSNLIVFERILKEKEYRDALTAAVIDLKDNYFTREIIEERVNAFYQIVDPYVKSYPDSQYHTDEFQNVYMPTVQAVSSEIEENYQVYLESLEMPLPFYVGTPQIHDDGTVWINWDPSYDFDNEAITYTCILSSSETFEEPYVLGYADGLRMPETHFDVQLEPGMYFVRVLATNESGYTRDCFDYYNHSSIISGKVYGCLAVMVNEDMTVTAVVNAE